MCGPLLHQRAESGEVWIAEQFLQGANIQQVLAAAVAVAEALKKDVKGLITKLENVAGPERPADGQRYRCGGDNQRRRLPVRHRLDGR
ncbi:hypothetical protein [Klebsiella pneumoniae]|uniref:hypothetical protein n=1 Tax=Klebsiella pneumoniae TaxID=573 RepID=UPI0022B68A81|nr:hypothetical protein [Klebsiella pneumoniae]